MEPRGFVGGIYRISEWIMRFSVINVLWILCSAPFFFVILLAVGNFLSGNITTEAELEQLVNFFLILLLVVAPFSFFPSTSAMFTVARKWVIGETDAPLFKTFFKGYKENFKQSILSGFIFSILLYILIIDFYFFNMQQNFIQYVFIAFILLVYITIFMFFSMIVHYEMKTFQLIKNAFLISLGRPIRSFTTAVLASAVLYISVVHLKWLIFFFTGSVIAYLAYWNFNIIYVKLQEKVEEMRKKAEEEEAEPEIAAELDREDLVKKSEENSK